MKSINCGQSSYFFHLFVYPTHFDHVMMQFYHQQKGTQIKNRHQLVFLTNQKEKGYFPGKISTGNQIW